MSGVFAVLRGGQTVKLAAKYGSTVEEVVRGLTSHSLTGSAVPLADVELDTAEGTKVRYSDVNSFEGWDRVAPGAGA